MQWAIKPGPNYSENFTEMSDTLRYLIILFSKCHVDHNDKVSVGRSNASKENQNTVYFIIFMFR